MNDVHERIGEVTERIQHRSHDARERYLEALAVDAEQGPLRGALSCTNLAHGWAACPAADKAALAGETTPNLGIVTAYNDVLSAHQPFAEFPELIKETARSAGAVAQVAAGVPAMCDGVTQGQTGMELSLFSRDVIAMATAVGLSHRLFDAAVFLGVCDKIVPGLLIGALSFGSVPTVFVPAGPMPSGLPNEQKSKTRQLYAEGKIGRAELLESESASYHSPGTCTFYGTANSNQMLMEFMGLHLPGASFANPNTPLRDELTRHATRRALAITALGNEYTPVGRVVDARAMVNGVVGLLATGGSTNHTLHLVAIARAAGLTLDWDDFAALSEVVPLLARIYPNGLADVNQFRDAGGIGFLIRELLSAGLLHEDVTTVWGTGLSAYAANAKLDASGALEWVAAESASLDEKVLASTQAPFRPNGGLRLLAGNLGRAVIKTSAIPEDRQIVEAPARVFETQEQFQRAFADDELNQDFVAVVRFQGPSANGMPELHALTPALGVLQDRGHRVALVTDGRMSGASGRIPAAIHTTPEAARGGPLAKVRTGDVIRVDAAAGILSAQVEPTEWSTRDAVDVDMAGSASGWGRELFASMRANVGPADAGACTILR